MRPGTITKLLMLGGGIAALVVHRARRGTSPRFRRRLDPLAPDPADPVQALDADLVPPGPEELRVDARPRADLAPATDVAALDADPGDRPRPPLDDDRYASRGENWVESLTEDAVESGPGAEYEVEIIIERELSGPLADRDRPVADLGSGGPRGV